MPKYTATVALSGAHRRLTVVFDDGELSGDQLAIALLRDRLSDLKRFDDTSAIPAKPSLDSPQGFGALCAVTFDHVIQMRPRLVLSDDS